MEKKKVLFVFGTRPEAIKMAPVILEFKKYKKEIITRVVVTAQHRQMLDQVLNLFEITPDYDLNIMKREQTLTQITTSVLTKLEKIIIKEKPDLILVQGDTTTTLAGSLSAYYQKISLGHIEAGLRTGNKYHPYPEEINRLLTDYLADLHFAPTKTAKNNLIRMGVNKESIYVTGNTVIDALFLALKKKRTLNYQLSTIENKISPLFSFRNYRLILVTAHRRESLGEPLQNICLALSELIRIYPDIKIIFSVHKNPKVQREVLKILSKKERIILTEPLDYGQFCYVMEKSYLILTDSGGIQEEAPSLGKPVLVMREVTERPEAVRAGTVKVVGRDKERIIREVRELLDNPAVYQKMAKAINPYGDGKAAERITSFILYYFGKVKDLKEEFNEGKRVN